MDTPVDPPANTPADLPTNPPANPPADPLLNLSRYRQCHVSLSRDKGKFANDERCVFGEMYAVCNPRLQEEYKFGRELLVAQQVTRGAKPIVNEMTLFRAVEPKDFQEAAENGVDVRKERGGRYGRGLYFATTPAGALSYFPTDRPMIVLQCKVMVGYARPSQHSDISLFHEPAGFDSIYGPMRTEQGYVVYSNNRVLVEHAAVVVLPAERAPPVIA